MRHARHSEAVSRLALPALLLAASCGSGGSAVAIVAPESLAYADPDRTVPTGTHAPQFVPAVVGGAPDSFSIDPALPTGLSLDPSSGVVAGLPTETLGETVFTITASNSSGSAATEIRIEVVEPFDEARFLYVSNVTDHTLSVFAVTADGGLRHHGYAAADLNPAALAGDPNGHFLYAAHPGTGQISVFEVDPATGWPTRVDMVAAGPNIGDIAIDPTGQWLFAACEGSVRSFRAAGAGTLTFANAVPADVAVAVAVHPAGHTVYASLYGSDRIGAYSVDPQTGALAELETEIAGTEPAALLLHPDGELLFAAFSGSDEIGVFAVDPVTGYLESRTTFATGATPVDLQLDSAGTTLFASALNGREITRFSVAPGSGDLTLVDALPTASDPFALELDPSGNGTYVTFPDTSDVGHVSTDQPGLETAALVRTRGGASDVLLFSGPTALEFEPALAFSANRDFGDVSTLSIDTTTGELTDLGQPIAAGTAPTALAVAPFGGFLYAADGTSGDLAQFAIADDTLTDIGAPVFAGSDPAALTVDPTGRFVFSVGADGLASFAIDPASGELSAVETIAGLSTASDLVVDPGGLYLYALDALAGEVRGFWIHGVLGSLEELDGSPWAMPGVTTAVALAMHPAGRHLYIADEGDGSVISFDIADDGELSAPVVAKVIQAPRNVDVSPDGQWLFGTSFTRNEITLCRVDPLTGALTTVATQTVGVGPSSVHVEVTGRFAYVADTLADQISIFSFDGGAGSLTLVEDVPLGAGAAPTAVVTDWQLVER